MPADEATHNPNGPYVADIVDATAPCVVDSESVCADERRPTTVASDALSVTKKLFAPPRLADVRSAISTAIWYSSSRADCSEASPIVTPSAPPGDESFEVRPRPVVDLVGRQRARGF